MNKLPALLYGLLHVASKYADANPVFPCDIFSENSSVIATKQLGRDLLLAGGWPVRHGHSMEAHHCSLSTTAPGAQRL